MDNETQSINEHEREPNNSQAQEEESEEKKAGLVKDEDNTTKNRGDSVVAPDMDAETVHFLEQIESAVADAKAQSKVLMVLCDNDNHLSQMKINKQLWQDETIIRLLTNYAVCLRVSINSVGFQHFTSIYRVSICPTVYFINSNNGGALQVIIGRDITHENILRAIESCITKTSNNMN